MKWFAMVVLAMACVSCDGWVESWSPVMHEGARVVSMGYTPERHGEGTGVGVSGRGDLVVTSASMFYPARWVVMFECAHGRFVVDRSRPELFEKLHEGDSVVVMYRERIAERRVDKQVVERRCQGYDFLDAEAVR